MNEHDATNPVITTTGTISLDELAAVTPTLIFQFPDGMRELKGVRDVDQLLADLQELEEWRAGKRRRGVG